MAVSMRFLAKASQSLESIVAHSPKALRTPKTPKTPKTPASPFAMSPLTSLTPAVSFFPETVEKVEKCIRKAPARSVHFEDATWVGNATRLLGGRLQPKVDASSPTDLATAASATRDAVLARFARQEDRCVPTPRVAGVGQHMAFVESSCLKEDPVERKGFYTPNWALKTPKGKERPSNFQASMFQVQRCGFSVSGRVHPRNLT